MLQKWLLYCTSLIYGLWVAVSSAEAKTNLLQVFQWAYDNDPQFHAQAFIWRSHEQQILINRSALLPQLAASGQSTWQDGSYDNSTAQKNSSIGLNLQQSIIDTANWQNYQESKITAKAFQIDYAAALQDLIQRTIAAYLDVLVAQNQWCLDEKARDGYADLLKWNQQRFQAGLAKQVDVDTAQLAYQRSLVNLISAKEEWLTKSAYLETIIGRKEEQLATLRSTTPLNKPSPLDLSTWVNSVHERNLVVRAEQYRLQAKREDINVQRAAHYPTLKADAGINQEMSNNATNNNGSDKRVTLTLSFPLYAGGKTSAQTLQTAYDYETLLEQYREKYRAQLEQLKNSYQGVLSGAKKLHTDIQMVAASQQVLQSTQVAYESGLSNINIDTLINARQNLYFNQQQLFSDKRDYLVNGIKLKQAAGVLSVQDVVQMNKWLEG